MTDERTKKIYQLWIDNPYIDEDTKKELVSLEHLVNEVEDRFYKNLEFGTGGLRGVIGAGTNRMNIYTIRKAAQGLSTYILDSLETKKTIVIAYDSRRMSYEFALEVALVCAGNGIHAYLFPEITSTPVLSFAVRYFKATSGVMITASHNPPEYNGLKVYGPDGGQLLTDKAEKVIYQVNGIQDFSEIKRLSLQEAEKLNLLTFLNEECHEAYIREVMKCSLIENEFMDSVENLKIIYTPLHGTGLKPVKDTLTKIGYKQLHIVPEQASPDSEFSTVKSPNPEEQEAFTLAIQIAKDIEADLIIGSDPDCDRMGAVVRNETGNYIVLSGNQTGVLLLYYLLNRLEEKGKLPHNGVVVKTIVTNDLGTSIAEDFGVSIINTLTGFKYIAEKINECEQSTSKKFLFGYEESFGYLTGNYARDKDAVVASMLISEAAAYYKQKGKSLCLILEEIYHKFGYILDKQHSVTLKGKDGMVQINHIMEHWRHSHFDYILEHKIVEMEDYSKGIDGFPIENVLKYKLDNGSWFCLRPSGTEPKLKIYFSIKDNSKENAEKQLKLILNFVLAQKQLN